MQIPENTENPRARLCSERYFYRFPVFNPLLYLEVALEFFQARTLRFVLKGLFMTTTSNALRNARPRTFLARLIATPLTRFFTTFFTALFARFFSALQSFRSRSASPLVACSLIMGAASNFSFSALAQTAPEVLLGLHPVSRLMEQPYSSWFQTQFDEYTPREEILAELRSPKLQRQFQKMKVKIFLGSWCGDSKREVPRFIKILRACNFPDKNIEIIGVSSNDSIYKQSPSHEERGYDIFRVPTFIFLDDGKETARINESPALSLERDIAAIVKQEAYTPNYRSFALLRNWLQEGVLNDENINVYGLATTLKSLARKESEIASAARVLQAQGKSREAKTLYRANALLFPQSSTAFSSLALFYEREGNISAAISAYLRAFELEPNEKQFSAKIMELHRLANSSASK